MCSLRSHVLRLGANQIRRFRVVRHARKQPAREVLVLRNALPPVVVVLGKPQLRIGGIRGWAGRREELMQGVRGLPWRVVDGNGESVVAAGRGIGETAASSTAAVTAAAATCSRKGSASKQRRPHVIDPIEMPLITIVLFPKTSVRTSAQILQKNLLQIPRHPPPNVLQRPTSRHQHVGGRAGTPSRVPGVELIRITVENVGRPARVRGSAVISRAHGYPRKGEAHDRLEHVNKIPFVLITRALPAASHLVEVKCRVREIEINHGGVDVRASQSVNELVIGNRVSLA